MGIVVCVVQEVGVEIFGVIFEYFEKVEVGKWDLIEYVVIKDMYMCKICMYEEVDVIVVFSGGVGFLDEFFEILIWW